MSTPCLNHTRTPEQALAEMREQFRALPITDPRRGPLAQRIVAMEDYIEARDAQINRAEGDAR